MRALGPIAAASALALAVAAACSSPAPRYPNCQRDEQCALGASHDYCVDGRCAHCRTSVDCGDREMCRAGECRPDPHAPPKPVLDAGDDGDDEAGSADDDEAGEPDDDSPPRAPPESPRRVLPQGVRRFFRP